MNFSVLMSIYCKEKPEYFDRAMKSIWSEQTVKPNEIILVQDGPLTKDIDAVIEKWRFKIGEVLKTVVLDSNVGLGEALNIGIRYCSYELIARMDTDDVSIPHRFQKQLSIFKEKEIDVCSAFIGEFEDNENKILSYRVLPEKHIDIVKYSKTRSPLNHAVVMFKKTIVEKAGGYQHMPFLEDYYLWARMIMHGARLYNIQEVLLKVRAGGSMIQRRRGFLYLKNELILLKRLRNIEFLTTFEYVKNIMFKIPVRLLPACFVKIVYKFLRKT